jgi:hypothetical protein
MNLVPKSVSRLASRSMLKLSANSPTILVVTGVVGLGATAVLAAKATRRLDPVLEEHDKARNEVVGATYRNDREEQKALTKVYASTGVELTKLYGPAVVVGTVSAASILIGHRILKGRHVATMLAFSGLQDQFLAYRKRVAHTFGEDREKEIYDGARMEYEEDPNHKGEYKLKSKYSDDKEVGDFLRPWFDETNVNWTRDPQSNYLFLKGVQQHMNNLLEVRGHVFLNDVYDSLRLDRRPEGAVSGWLRKEDGGKDGFIDFGFMTSQDPNTVAFRNGQERSVRLNFNTDGLIWDKI